MNPLKRTSRHEILVSTKSEFSALRENRSNTSVRSFIHSHGGGVAYFKLFVTRLIARLTDANLSAETRDLHHLRADTCLAYSCVRAMRTLYARDYIRALIFSAESFLYEQNGRGMLRE